MKLEPNEEIQLCSSSLPHDIRDVNGDCPTQRHAHEKTEAAPGRPLRFDSIDSLSRPARVYARPNRRRITGSTPIMAAIASDVGSGTGDKRMLSTQNEPPGWFVWYFPL